MYQVIINHWGLSLGEIETINNLFHNYEVVETDGRKNDEYASNLEIEFVKNVKFEFFSCISIEKWNIFVDVIKNIKKRRGNKGLKFKMTITDYIEDSGSNDHNIVDNSNSKESRSNEEVEIELLFYRRIIFLLGHKNQNEFVKGVERIEITIENMTEIFNQTNKFGASFDNEQIKKSNYNNPCSSQTKSFKEYKQWEEKIQLYVFVFDYDKRIWKAL